MTTNVETRLASASPSYLTVDLVPVTPATRLAAEHRVAMAPRPTYATLTIAHVALAHKRYPGERVQFYTEVRWPVGLAAYTVDVFIPARLLLHHYPKSDKHCSVTLKRNEQGQQVTLACQTGQSQAGSHNFTIECQLPLVITETELSFATTAWVRAGVNLPEVDAVQLQFLMKHNWRQDAHIDKERVVWPAFTEETAVVTVETKSAYLQYLPALYERDVLMNQLLQLLEGFWAPLEGQLTNIEDYFDPTVTPFPMLQWLAAWFGLRLERAWFPDEAAWRRAFIQLISPYEYQDASGRLHRLIPLRQRGTRLGLQKFLAICTGMAVAVYENSAQLFPVGVYTYLSPSLTIGSNYTNPQNFIIQLPPIANAEEKARLQLIIKAIVEAEKPLNTTWECPELDLRSEGV